MMRRNYLLLALVLLLLIPVGMVAAQSSANFTTQHTVIAGGGTAGSANFAVVSVIGQPVTDVARSTNYTVTGGFLFTRDRRVWLPMLLR